MFGTVLGGTRAETQAGSVFTLDAVDTASSAVQRASLDFLAHGIAFDPTAPARLATFEKRGPGGAVVIIGADSLTLEQHVLPTPGRHFYGHAAFSGDGAKLFVVESDLATHQGTVAVRDGRTLAPLGEFPTYGVDPHDCVLLDDRRTLCITNAGGVLGSSGADACLTLVDCVTEKLVQRFVFSDPKINAGHVAIRADKSFAVVSAPRAGLDMATSVGGITLRSAPSKPERMRSPKVLTDAELLGESLSVCMVQDTVVVTTPEANLVTFWSLQRGKLLGTLALEFPRGVLHTGSSGLLVVSYGRSMPRLAVVDLETYKVMPDMRLPEGVCSGSHLYRYGP
jgi:uncharacterized protein